MVKRSIFTLILIVLSACANLSKNQIIDEEFDLRGGKFGNQQWDQALVFNRTSWYTELTLVYDVLLAQMNEGNPFWQWLSNSEKESIKACSNHYVAVAYAQDSAKISHTDFKNMAREAGYRSFALPQFSSYLKLHPDFSKNSFHLYQVFGLCLEPDKASRDNILIQFPNFKEVVLK